MGNENELPLNAAQDTPPIVMDTSQDVSEIVGDNQAGVFEQPKTAENAEAVEVDGSTKDTERQGVTKNSNYTAPVTSPVQTRAMKE